MKTNRHNTTVKLVIAIAITAALFGCETLKSMISVERPQVRVQGAELTALSFDGAEVTVDLAIHNPNAIGISMSGFSYEFQIEGNRFLDGDIDEPIQIDPMGSSSLRVPVAFGFRDLVDTVQSLGDAEEATYAVNLDLRFELPILGQISVPVRADGTFPVVRVPALRLRTVHLDSITLSGASLRLEVAIRNPNAFALDLNSLVYDFSVDHTSWADGGTSRPQRIDAGQESIITIPFNLRLLSLGRAVRDILTSNDDLNYQFEADLAIGTELPLIRDVNLPISRSGTVPLRR